jgi:hypothetical protein
MSASGVPRRVVGGKSSRAVAEAGGRDSPPGLQTDATPLAGGGALAPVAPPRAPQPPAFARRPEPLADALAWARAAALCAGRRPEGEGGVLGGARGEAAAAALAAARRALSLSRWGALDGTRATRRAPRPFDAPPPARAPRAATLRATNERCEGPTGVRVRVAAAKAAPAAAARAHRPPPARASAPRGHPPRRRNTPTRARARRHAGCSALSRSQTRAARAPCARFACSPARLPACRRRCRKEPRIGDTFQAALPPLPPPRAPAAQPAPPTAREQALMVRLCVRARACTHDAHTHNRDALLLLTSRPLSCC